MTDVVRVDPRPTIEGPEVRSVFAACGRGNHRMCCGPRVRCQRDRGDHVEVGWDVCSCCEVNHKTATGVQGAVHPSPGPEAPVAAPHAPVAEKEAPPPEPAGSLPEPVGQPRPSSVLEEMDDRPRAAREAEAAPRLVHEVEERFTAPVAGARVAVVGSRGFLNLERVRARVRALPRDTVVVSGGAEGVDTAAEEEAHALGMPKPVVFRPKALTSYALLARNQEIAEACTSLVAFHARCAKCRPGTCPRDGWSHGTADVVERARKLGKPVEVVREQDAPAGVRGVGVAQVQGPPPPPLHEPEVRPARVAEEAPPKLAKEDRAPLGKGAGGARPADRGIGNSPAADEPRRGPPAPNEEQAHALALLEAGRSIYLSGPAGVGKTFTLNLFLDQARKNGRRVAVTASTGIAALNLGGRTLHSWLGLRPNAWDVDRIVADERWQRSSMWAIRRAQALVLDEVSMVDGRLLDTAEALCRAARSDDGERPWGGLQLVFVGDLGQLPPVELEVHGFAFQSLAWICAGLEIVELAKVVRQSDEVFVRVLKEVRVGRLSEEGIRVLGARVRAFDPDDPATPAVRVVTHNAQKDAINKRKLDALPGDPVQFLAMDHCAKNSAGEAALGRLSKDCLSPHELLLKVGARVMFTRNAGKKESVQYVNGSTGTVIQAEPGRARVRLDRGGAEIEVQRAEWTIEGRDGEPLASRAQLPLCLAWATTVHKSQGQTLDRVSLDLARTFAPGQAYVALSRCRTLEGLNLESDLSPRHIFAHPQVMAWEQQRSAPQAQDGGW